MSRRPPRFHAFEVRDCASQPREVHADRKQRVARPAQQSARGADAVVLVVTVVPLAGLRVGAADAALGPSVQLLVILVREIERAQVCRALTGAPALAARL